jgi:hypothetical protein
MIWHFSNLWNDDQLFLLGFPNLMDEIETLIESDLKEKAKISAWIGRVFSDLGLIARIRHEIDIYHPWAAGFEHEYVTQRSTIEKGFPRRFAALGELDCNLKDQTTCQVTAQVWESYPCSLSLPFA